MLKTFLKRKEGFTLIELAIILVIVGLIASGIIGASKLVTNAKATSIFSDIGLYTNAVVLFNTQYDALPGDWALATDNGALNNGAGDGKITLSGAAGTAVKSIEGINAWAHLVQTSFLFVPYTTACKDIATCDTMDIKGGVNVPGSKIQNTGYSLYSIIPNNADGTNGTTPRVILALGGNESAKGTLPLLNTIPGNIAKLVAIKVSGMANPTLRTPSFIGASGYNRLDATESAKTYVDANNYTLNYILPL